MKGSASDGEAITVWDIVQYHYCPRKVYFLRVMEVPAVVRRKMEYSEEIHEREKRRMEERRDCYGFNRGDVEEVIQDLQVESQVLGLRGKLDAVIRLKTGELIPVETKYTDAPIPQRHYLKQLYAYALLLEEHTGKPVKRGVIYFSQQREPRLVEITHSDKEAIKRDIETIVKMVEGESPPRQVSPEKCRYCEVQRYCV
jgi:CRISPR-associated exonuclease Cas4